MMCVSKEAIGEITKGVYVKTSRCPRAPILDIRGIFQTKCSLLGIVYVSKFVSMGVFDFVLRRESLVAFGIIGFRHQRGKLTPVDESCQASNFL